METEYYFAEDTLLKLYQLYRRTGAAMHKARRKELRRYKLSDSEVAVLFMVHFSKNQITPAGIAHQMIQDNHATAQQVVRMEKRGLLRKVKDLPRTNQVRVVLTDYGEEMYQKSQKNKSIHEIVSVLSEKERDQLSIYLYKLWEKATEIYE
jgi:DNA-binding MarR family transcriptional regulator